MLGVGIAKVWTAGFPFPSGQEIFLYSTASSHLFNGYRARFPRRRSGLNVKLTTRLNLVPRSIMMDVCLHFLIPLHGTVLSYLSTGPALLFYFYSSEKCGYGISNCTVTASFQIISNSLFTDHPTIQCYTIRPTDSVVKQTLWRLSYLFRCGQQISSRFCNTKVQTWI
jgi:hypothetical protein